MGVTYKPEDARKRRRKDNALNDLDPSLRNPTSTIMEGRPADDLERKATGNKNSKKSKSLK
jgi:hypothetical protein